MNAGIVVAIVAAFSAVVVSLISAWLSSRSSIVFQIRKLKEEHYVAYIEALHHLLAEDESDNVLAHYVLTRDRLFLIADENVIKKMIANEGEDGVIRNGPGQDAKMTELIKAMRRDLKLNDKDFPRVSFKTWRKPSSPPSQRL